MFIMEILYKHQHGITKYNTAFVGKTFDVQEHT